MSTANPSVAEGPEGRFTQGSIMRHVLVMTSTASIGLMFMFLIDAATLWWVSQIGEERLVAALGFAFTVQLFTISIGIGLMIPATALVARSLGARQVEMARLQATVCIMITVTGQSLVALLVFVYAPQIIALMGATGETAEISARFLRISVVALPIMAVGMICSAILRAQGDALRSMSVTLTAGTLAMVLDPLFIFTFGLGIDGAAYVVVISRVVTAFLGLYYILVVHKLVAKPTFADLRMIWVPFWAIALPSLVTQMAAPFGNYVVTRVMAEFGDSAVAGWAVVSRLTMLAFGGLYALSGAVGGIFGQNYGAQKMERVVQAYRDGVVFCFCYVLVAWALMAALTPMILSGFGLANDAAEVVRAFTFVAAGSFFFTGVMFVSNAAFNNLGKPALSAGFNWLRDGLLMYPLAIAFSMTLFGPGVIYAQGAAALLSGIASGVYGWYFVKRMAAAQS